MHHTYNAGLHRFAVVTACATFVLIVAGGLVTSNDAGLSVPDWPLSYGTWMPPLVGGILYEHTHRMIAAGVGLLTIVLNLWLWKSESRRWVRRLGLLALAAVIVQGLLGGITVLFFLPAPVSVIHACLAQIFFCLAVTLAVVTGDYGEYGDRLPVYLVLNRETESLSPYSLATVAVFIQLILGSILRHSGTVQGSKGVVLVPAALIAHLVGAAAVTSLVIYAAVRLVKTGQQQLLAYLLLGLLVVQLLLGLGSYLIRLSAADRVQPLWGSVVVTTSHVAVGALLLAVSLMLMLKSRWNLGSVRK